MSPGITFHAPRSARECEGMNPHTPKWTPTLGVEVPMDLWIFKGQFQRSKLIGLRSSLYHWKALGTKMFKMGSHDPFGHLKHKLWPKEGLGIKLVMWFLTTKSWESPWFPSVQVACHIPLERTWQGLRLCINHILIERLQKKLWASKVIGVPISRISDLQLGSPGTKWHQSAGLMAKHIEYYKGEGGDFPQVRAIVNLVNLCLPMSRLCIKSAPTMYLPTCCLVCAGPCEKLTCLSLFLVPIPEF
jgi:hypothetical protein